MAFKYKTVFRNAGVTRLILRQYPVLGFNLAETISVVCGNFKAGMFGMVNPLLAAATAGAFIHIQKGRHI
jgi:hypothetical protein